MLARHGIVQDWPRKGRRLQTGPAPIQARNLLGYCKQIFGWALDRGDYGIEVSPCSDLKASKIIGDKKSGDRILSDDELFAFWRATTRMQYPYKQVYQLLSLTALRLNEAARAAWSEFDLPNKTWVIPAARMKGKNAKAREHVVPLTDDMIAILESLPRFKRGAFLFSTTFGKKPIWLNNKTKKSVDQRMLRTLRALARRRGEDDPAKVELSHWTNHDIRRTVRSGLSRLRIAEEVREAVLAHVRPGIRGVYDHYQYFDEKKEALTLWAARLQSIVDPPPSSNVVRLRS
jgi:integrase